jgi:hypothetical protein
MSRLEKHLEKEAKKRLFFLIVFFLVAAYLFFSFGLPVVINTSVFISKIAEKPAANLSSETKDNYALLNINEIPTATNSPKVLISGGTFNLNKVAIYLNGKKVAQKNVSGNLDINYEINDLIEGDNEIYLVGYNKKDELIKKTRTFSVLYKNTKPKLEITTPKDNETVSNQNLVIKGSTDKETVIQINETPVVVDALGNFESEINLNEGENKIKITATDIAGNQEEKTITVIYQKED